MTTITKRYRISEQWFSSENLDFRIRWSFKNPALSISRHLFLRKFNFSEFPYLSGGVETLCTGSCLAYHAHILLSFKCISFVDDTGEYMVLCGSAQISLLRHVMSFLFWMILNLLTRFRWCPPDVTTLKGVFFSFVINKP